jgi:hypothetical protein
MQPSVLIAYDTCSSNPIVFHYIFTADIMPNRACLLRDRPSCDRTRSSSDGVMASYTRTTDDLICMAMCGHQGQMIVVRQ